MNFCILQKIDLNYETYCCFNVDGWIRDACSDPAYSPALGRSLPCCRGKNQTSSRVYQLYDSGFSSEGWREWGATLFAIGWQMAGLFLYNGTGRYGRFLSTSFFDGKLGWNHTSQHGSDNGQIFIGISPSAVARWKSIGAVSGCDRGAVSVVGSRDVYSYWGCRKCLYALCEWS